MDLGRSCVRDGLVNAVERNFGRVLGRWISGNAGCRMMDGRHRFSKMDRLLFD